MHCVTERLGSIYPLCGTCWAEVFPPHTGRDLSVLQEIDCAAGHCGGGLSLTTDRTLPPTAVGHLHSCLLHTPCFTAHPLALVCCSQPPSTLYTTVFAATTVYALHHSRCCNHLIRFAPPSLPHTTKSSARHSKRVWCPRPLTPSPPKLTTTINDAPCCRVRAWPAAWCLTSIALLLWLAV